jgi:hypothetical protein
VDPFDQFLVGKILKDRWTIKERHEVIHEAHSACRTYQAEGPEGTVAFVKVLVPDPNIYLDEQRRQIDEFLYEITVVKQCSTRNMRRVVRALDSDKILLPGTVPIPAHYTRQPAQRADAQVRRFAGVIHGTQLSSPTGLYLRQDEFRPLSLAFAIPATPR